MGVTQLDMTSLRWSVSTATRWDTLQGNVEDLETKIAGTRIKPTLEDCKNGRKLLAKAMVAIDGAGSDWSYMADNEVLTNMALMVFSDFEGHPQKEDQGYVDSGCSRHMTGNMSYLSDFKEFDGGYVTFGGGAKGGKITGKGTLKTGKLDFEDVYFVKELQFNLFSVSQMCDKKNSVLFTDTGCFVLSPDFKLADESQVLLKVPRKNNMYSVDMKNIVPKECLTCLVAKVILEESMLWHRRLGHVNFKTINKLVNENLVRGLPTNHFENDQTCVACLKGKQHKASSTKDETSGILKSFIIVVENLVNKKVKIIRCDNGTEFKNRVISEFCEKKGIKKEFSNKVLVVKPYNKTPYDLFRGRTPALSFIRPFGCHVTILNTLDYLGKFNGKSDEGFFVGYSLNSKAFRVYNIRTRKVEENLHIRFLEDKPIIAGTEESIGAGNASNDKPQPSSDAGKKDDEGVSKESRINDQERSKNSTQDVNIVGPSINIASTNVNTGSLNINTVCPTVTTARSISSQTEPAMFSLRDNPTFEVTHADFFSDETKVDMSNITTTYLVPSTLNTRIHKDHSLAHVIGDIQFGVQTRRMTKPTNKQGFISAVYEGKIHEDLHTCLFAYFLSQEEPKRIAKSLSGLACVEAMQEKLLQIEEEVYVCQPPGFEDLDYPDKVYKVVKALYGLHQAPRAWYETLAKYLLDNGFHRGKIDQTLFIKKQKGDIFLVHVYVDDIIFGSTKKELCTEFEKLMHDKFQMSSIGELTFFLGIASTSMDTEKALLEDLDGDDVDVHIYRSMIRSLMYLTSSRLDIMFAVCAYARFQVTPKVSHLHAIKRIFRCLKGQPKLGLWYPRDSSFDLVAYSDSVYAGASLDRKSTTGGHSTLDSESNAGLKV
ncbi:putative ribonuclease H-like domain-containing protein [Tanacetum coccineum]|uniref:Ribonuclease H-like domain-containing protein n=1 Tax=Tanacetum coccineum TaxID=301880 RepID=A0ABQ4ZAJ8_9ASTR